MNTFIRKSYYKLYHLFGSLIYDVTRKKYIFPKINTIEESIQKIINDKVSVARFGDGELNLMNAHTKKIVFQDFDSQLSKRLKEVLSSEYDNIIICLPESFRNLCDFGKKQFHKNYIWSSYNFVIQFLDLNRTYYNAYLSRPYRDFLDQKKAMNRFELLKQVWNLKNVILVEGEHSRIGVGTDLFDNSTSLKRVLCPTKNAFKIYNNILNSIMQYSSDNLILIALGPTATVLAYDLACQGFQAIDIGHIGSEYFSFLKAIDKSNSLTEYNFEMYDTKYESEIIQRITF